MWNICLTVVCSVCNRECVSGSKCLYFIETFMSPCTKRNDDLWYLHKKSCVPRHSPLLCMYIQHGGWKWDSRSYVTKHRAERQDGLLLERAGLLAIEASACTVRYGAIWEITHLHSSWLDYPGTAVILQSYHCYWSALVWKNCSN